MLAGAITTDMFWKTFGVLGTDERLFDDVLWRRCRFRFRHAISDRHAVAAHCGGLRPTRDMPQVSMRGLC